MTPEAALILIETYEIDKTLADAEEVELLDKQNPELLAAMRALEALANDVEGDYE